MSIHECCTSCADDRFSDEMEAEGRLGHRSVRSKDASLKIDGFKRDWGIAQSQPAIEPKARQIAQINGVKIQPMGGKASGEVNVSVSWGGKDGAKVNVGASGQVSDKKGNFIKAEIKREENGEVKTSASAGGSKEKK
jgi:hypothetical protein